MGFLDKLKHAFQTASEQASKQAEEKVLEKRRQEQWEAFYSDSQAQNMQKKYYALYEKVENEYKLVNQLGAFSSERGKKLLTQIKQGITLFDEMVEIWRRYDQDVPNNPFYYRLAVVYEKAEKYKLAAQTCVDAIKAGYSDDGTKGGMESRLARMVKKGHFEPTAEMCELLNISKDDIKGERPKKKAHSSEEQSEHGTLVPVTQVAESVSVEGWHISVSFGKSSSQNYLKAVTLAKAAPQYYEQEIDGKILHQAFYSSKASEYLAFIMLFELVWSWKSSFVMINGALIDRKLVSQLNYCYGDRCRSGNPKFCYGASFMTENPFGCHRLQINACSNPWWSYFKRDGNKYVLDKSTMVEQVNATAERYSICPCFDYEQIMYEIDHLPNSVTATQYKQLCEKNSQ